MPAKKYRILQTIRQGQIGGGESHLLSLVENINTSIFEPVVLSFTPGPMVDKLNAMNIPVHVIHTEKPFDFTKWKQVRQLMETENISLVHAHGTRANSNVFWGAKKNNLPLVYTIHGWSFHDDQNPVVRKIRMLGEKVLLSRSNVNISVAESNRATGERYFGDFNSVVINNGIDQAKFNPRKGFKDIRAELNIDKNDVVILFIARFIHQKQPLKLIRAFQRIVQKLPAVKLVMVGDGNQKQEALQLIRQFGLEYNVIFQPFRSDVPDILAAADIFVLPSLWEGLPIGLLEAMAMGKAIVATHVDGTKEVIQHGENGLLIPVENLEYELAHTLIRLALSPEMRKKLGAAAQQTITTNFNAANMTRKIEQVYMNLLSNYRSSPAIGQTSVQAI